MKQMSAGQNKASTALVAYIQDVLDLEKSKSFLLLLCSILPALKFSITKNPTCSTGNRCATVP